MNTVRNYPVPRQVATAVNVRVTGDRLHDMAVSAAATGRVRGYQLPLLAAGEWRAGAEWATAVLEREGTSRQRKAEALLASIGYDDADGYVYHGVLDSDYPDHEIIVSVARSQGDETDLERWNGLDWGTVDVDADGVEYVLLDRDVLADVLEALDSGSAGMVLRPFEPKAWMRGDTTPMDCPVLAAGPPPRHTGAMVALYPDAETANRLAVGDGEDPSELHVTLAYLGDTEDEAIDYQAVQRAVAKWARRVGPMEGEISGPGSFTAGEDPVQVALVDLPDLPAARELLVRLLESEGVDVKKDHGYTPHITLRYGEQPADVENHPLRFEAATAKYADDVQEYLLGEPMVAAGGSGPDTIYAVVDEFDTSAVLDLIRVTPGPVAYRRTGGAWVKDSGMLMRLMGVDPPPVVAVDPAQAADVVNQVDAYDRQNPAKGDKAGVVAAGSWEEWLHPRKSGKFAKKNSGDSNGSKPRRSLREGKPNDMQGKRPTAAQIRKQPWLALALGNDANHRDLDMGLGKDFWSKQPRGFRGWAIGFMNRKRAESRKRDASDWQKDVPEQYKKAMNQFVEAVGVKAEHPHRGPIQYNKDGSIDSTPEKSGASGSSRAGKGSSSASHAGRGAKGGLPSNVTDETSPAVKRIERLDKADRDHDLGFAKEGLAESRRRDHFDRQVAGTAERLLKSGANAQAVARVMRKRIMEEQRRRDEFERKRRLRAEQERVRRMAARNHESDLQAQTAAAKPEHSRMPGTLEKYWASGKGAAKIRWGTSGDFNRCRRALAKYLRPDQVAGACANLHRLATGSWPGKGRKH